MEKHSICIVLPMYNEEQSFPSLRQMFDASIKTPPGLDFKIIAVNDGSYDGTLKLAQLWKRENPRVTVISHETNLGLGQAILTGFQEAIKAGSTIIITMDADASHPAEVIFHLTSAIAEGADIAIASRFTKSSIQKGVPFVRKMYSLGARFLLSQAFPLKGVRDYTTGFRAYKTQLVKKALAKSNAGFLKFNTFTCTAEILLKTATLAEKIVEVPLILRYDRKQSPSKMKLLATIRDYMKLCALPKQKCPLGKGLRLI